MKVTRALVVLAAVSIVAWSPTGPIHTTADTVAGVDTPHLQTVGVVTIQAVLDLAGNG